MREPISRGISARIANNNFYEVSNAFCDEARCKDPVLANQLMEVSFLPNKEELQALCPKGMAFLECEKDFVECSGLNLEDLAKSSDKTKAAKAMAMLAGSSLAREICDEDSSFHTDYISSVGCYREYFSGAARNCRRDITKPVEDFFDQLYAEADEEDIGDEIFNEIQCLKNAYELVCLVDNLGDACGSAAQRTARHALETFKGVLGAGSCTKLENAADLKTRFLDFLELDTAEKNRVQGIFDLFKRRR